MIFQNVVIDYCQNTTAVTATLAVTANSTGPEGTICTGEASSSFIPNQGPVPIFPPAGPPFPFRRILSGNWKVQSDKKTVVTAYNPSSKKERICTHTSVYSQSQ
jgi:hypothetical protein